MTFLNSNLLQVTITKDFSKLNDLLQQREELMHKLKQFQAKSSDIFPESGKIDEITNEIARIIGYNALDSILLKK